jgi:hypothetical protein
VNARALERDRSISCLVPPGPLPGETGFGDYAAVVSKPFSPRHRAGGDGVSRSLLNTLRVLAWLVAANYAVMHAESAAAQPPSPLDQELLDGLGSDPLDPVDRQPAEAGPAQGQKGVDQPDEDLQRRLRRELGDAAEKESDNPLLEIARKMRDAERRLDQHDAGPTTQIVQKEIVDDLEKLIDQARKAAKQPAGGQSRSQPVASRQPVGQPSTGGEPQGGQPNDRPAADSTQRPRAANDRPRQVDVEQVQAIIKELWGELPEREREQMLESPPEEFLPKYELLIEEYFRRLSEERTP